MKYNQLTSRVNFFLTLDVDDAGSSGNPMSVFHLDSEVAMVDSDSITDHQCRLALLGLVYTQTLTQGSHKLLLWFWNLQQEIREEIHKTFRTLRRPSEVTNLRFGLLLLDDRNNLLSGLFGDILIILQPGDFGIRGARDVGINADFLTFLDAQAGLHASMQGDLWFFCKQIDRFEK